MGIPAACLWRNAALRTHQHARTATRRLRRHQAEEAWYNTLYPPYSLLPAPCSLLPATCSLLSLFVVVYVYLTRPSITTISHVICCITVIIIFWWLIYIDCYCRKNNQEYQHVSSLNRPSSHVNGPTCLHIKLMILYLLLQIGINSLPVTPLFFHSIVLSFFHLSTLLSPTPTSKICNFFSLIRRQVLLSLARNLDTGRDKDLTRYVVEEEMKFFEEGMIHFISLFFLLHSSSPLHYIGYFFLYII